MARKREENDTLIYFEPRPGAQTEAIEVFQNNDIVFLLGPAGSTKTHTAVYLALKEMQDNNTQHSKRVNKVIITRPIVEAGEYLGALPGEVHEKVHPYMLPVYECVSKMIGDSKAFIADNFEIAPLAYMRGRNWSHCVAILDEAQNCTIGQLLLFLSRLDTGGKIIVAGDMDQSDIGNRSGLKPWADALKNVNGIGFVHFTEADIARHPLVKIILAKKPKGHSGK